MYISYTGITLITHTVNLPTRTRPYCVTFPKLCFGKQTENFLPANTSCHSVPTLTDFIPVNIQL